MAIAVPAVWWLQPCFRHGRCQGRDLQLPTSSPEVWWNFHGGHAGHPGHRSSKAGSATAFWRGLLLQAGKRLQPWAPEPKNGSTGSTRQGRKGVQDGVHSCDHGGLLQEGDWLQVLRQHHCWSRDCPRIFIHPFPWKTMFSFLWEPCILSGWRCCRWSGGVLLFHLQLPQPVLEVPPCCPQISDEYWEPRNW